MDRGQRDNGEPKPISIKDSEYVGSKNNQNLFKVLSLNAQSINNKFESIRQLTADISPSILAIQETWGKNVTTEYSIKGYHKPEIVARKGDGMNLGGGIGLWIRKSLDYEPIKVRSIDRQCEMQAINLPDLNITIVNLYRPFGDIHVFFTTLDENLDLLAKEFPTNELIVVGDFNIDVGRCSALTSSISQLTLEYDLIQQVTLPTRITKDSSAILDHVYTKLKRESISNVVKVDISDHYPVLTSISSLPDKRAKVEITKRWFTADTYIDLATLLRHEDWSELLTKDCEAATNHLVDTIVSMLDLLAPVETKTMKDTHVNRWITPGIARSQKRAADLYKRWRAQVSNSKFEEEYKQYRKVLRSVIREAKRLEIQYSLEDADNDGRKMWSIMNEVVDRKQCRHRIPSRFIIEGESVRNTSKIANAFNHYFASIGSKMANSIPHMDGFESYLEQVHSIFDLARPDSEIVLDILKNQKPKLSHGKDTINNRVVKLCCNELTIPMTHIISCSIEEALVPTQFKIARIIPLYKKGAANECGNYRPVSLLSALSKILEKAVCRQLMQYFKTSFILCPDQFGFRPKSQTTHVVQKLLNFISENSKNNKVTIATFLDLSKAFDCLQYDQLFIKMKFMGFSNHCLDWFKSYLSGRTQYVDLDGKTSEIIDMELGVPQGSILGPILFLIYINDVNKSDPTAFFTKFADDTTVVQSGNNLLEATENMNATMVKVHAWFQKNKLNLNPSKTRYMVFNGKGTTETNLVKVDNTFIERVWTKGKETSFKLVGIHIDEKLSWGDHINQVAKKMGYANYSMTKSHKILNKRSKKLLYSGLMHSHLVFGAPIWGFAAKCKLDKLLKQQKKAIRKIFNLKHRDHTNEFFVKAKILKVPELMEHTTLCSVGIAQKIPSKHSTIMEHKGNQIRFSP